MKIKNKILLTNVSAPTCG